MERTKVISGRISKKKPLLNRDRRFFKIIANYTTMLGPLTINNYFRGIIGTENKEVPTLEDIDKAARKSGIEEGFNLLHANAWEIRCKSQKELNAYAKQVMNGSCDNVLFKGINTRFQLHLL